MGCERIGKSEVSTHNGGERLIDVAAEIARRKGYEAMLCDSILINMIREMSRDEIMESVR